jgi:hypothetical protein
MRTLSIRASAAAVLIAAAALPVVAGAQPDLSGFWTVKFERERSGRALIDELPEEALLLNDTGAAELAAGEFGGLRLQPAAIEEVRNYDYTQELKRENTCTAPSVAFYMQAPFPMEIYHGSDMIVFKMEYFDLYRVVFLDGREHPPATAPHSKSGHSVGRWEGDTLIVNTTHVSRGTFMNNGFSHSDDIRLVERFRLSPDGSTLWLTQLYEDPEVFEGMAARYMAWTRVAGEYVYPYECDASYGN